MFPVLLTSVSGSHAPPPPVYYHEYVAADLRAPGDCTMYRNGGP